MQQSLILLGVVTVLTAGAVGCSHDHDDDRRAPAKARDNYRDRDHDGIRDGMEDRNRDGVRDGDENGGRNRRPNPDLYR